MSELAAALVAALADISVVDRARTAKVEMKSGGSYSYSYADIGDVITATRPALAAQGIVALTPVSARPEGGLQVVVTLLHKSGERMDFEPLPFQGSNDPQAAGSMITYFRRYALCAALGIATGDDDDGAAGSRSASGRKTTRPAEAAPATTEKGQPQRPACPVCNEPLTGKDSVPWGDGFAHEKCAAS